MINKMKIGSVELDSNVVLAPMAGITDITFRTICKKFGPGLMYTEMVSAKGLYYRDSKTAELMKVREENRPVALQIFGSDPEIMAYVVEKYINDRKDIDIIDINMGCPAPKIVKNGDGSALMKDVLLAGRIVKSLSKVSLKPVTVKIRSGWDAASINAPEFAKAMEDSGAAAIAIHGRTREQYYSGKADYIVIKAVKESVNIPVIGNGDIYEACDAVRMKKETSCDGVMIGRGALGNPWLISSVKKAMAGETESQKPTLTERVEMFKHHAAMLCEETNEHISMLEMRKHAGWYLKGLHNSSEVRAKINKAVKTEELFTILDEYVQNFNMR